MNERHDTDTTCHCGASYGGSDHCPACGCEQYESRCVYVHVVGEDDNCPCEDCYRWWAIESEQRAQAEAEIEAVEDREAEAERRHFAMIEDANEIRGFCD